MAVASRKKKSVWNGEAGFALSCTKGRQNAIVVFDIEQETTIIPRTLSETDFVNDLPKIVGQDAGTRRASGTG